MINNHISYKTKNGTFYSRTEFIESTKKCRGDAEFNSASFVYANLPKSITTENYVDPVIASKLWLQKLKNQNKPLVLLFSGGVDSIFALNCMLESGFPPDYILVYTLNPFDRNDIMCSHDMEPISALHYLNEKIHNDLRLKNSKIWHIHLDKDYAEEFFCNNKWLNISGYSHSIETLGLWFDLPKIDEKTVDKFTFIKGGDVPSYTIVDGKLNFFIVDLQLGERIDIQPVKCYDFVLDNELMFNSLCVKYAQKINQNIKTEKKNCAMYKKNRTLETKYLLDEFSSLLSNCVPQLDKRFSEIITDNKLMHKTDNDFLLQLHKTPLKTWLLYLQAELFQPDWFQKYKKTVLDNRKWVEEINDYPGKLSQFVEFK